MCRIFYFFEFNSCQPILSYGVATSYISEALGHQTEEQTQTYLDGFENGVISSLESKIFDF